MVPSELRPKQKGFTTLRHSSPTRRRCVRLSPIAQDSLLLPPVGVGAVSHVPVWLIILSDQLSVVGLVSRYLTNYLMERNPLPMRLSALMTLPSKSHVMRY